ncbi:MAG: hypothetical protein MJZ12_06380 [Prevotella sp.]|nr:hypothetical protein [Prevotella sp.]
MKKYLLYTLTLLSVLSFQSCKDNDSEALDGTNREFMTMFITDTNRGKGDQYPYNSGLDPNSPHGNTIHLYWYGVKDCAGFQVQMALQPKVSNGEEAWASIQGTNDLLLDTIVGPEVLQLVIPDLAYSVDYRFAIRALSKQDPIGSRSKASSDPTNSFPHASTWYGHGNGRQWQEYLGIQTSPRYETPYAIYVDQSQTTETTMKLYLNRKFSQLGLDDDPDTKADKIASYTTNFNVTPLPDGDYELGYSVITVEPSPSNPNSTVGEKWKRYELTQADYDRGYITIDGLTANSVYVINAIDPRVTIPVDAKYNTVTTRSDGTPGPAIILDHQEMITKYSKAPLTNFQSEITRDQVFAAASDYDAAPISPVLYNFISDANYAEGQTFYLQGGKTYYIDGNDITCKGFVLATDPKDVAQGKRARVICGIGKNSQLYSGTNGEQAQGSFTMFMFGRQPEAGEGGEIYMKKLAFENIDFDNPTSLNYGDNLAGVGTIAGNYFFNMYSNGMAVTLDSLVIKDCKFKRLVRGFIREQGANYKVWKHVLIDGNWFYDCGYYNQGAGGYCWIAGSGNNQDSNLYHDMKVVNNTFYDSPFPAFFSEENEQLRKGGKWNITFSNNTLINFNTRASGAIIKMRNIPNNSVFNVQNNLIVLTKSANDQRVLSQWGADVRSIETLSDGTSGHITLNFGNNWSTTDNLTSGSIFTANPWTATSNNFGKFVKENTATLNGTLEVNVADISATELFTQPNPPHVAQSASDRHMHRADALDGTATTQYNVNLYYKNKNNDIVKNNVGAPCWNK